MFAISADIPYQHIAFEHGIVVSVKRIDLVHPHIAGNKFYKLKYNLQAAREQGKTLLISFGGAYSNHIHALAHAAHEYGFQALGIIRGQELAEQPLNPTLQDAAALGMQLQFISRADYRQKHTPEFLQAAFTERVAKLSPVQWQQLSQHAADTLGRLYHRNIKPLGKVLT